MPREAQASKDGRMKLPRRKEIKRDRRNAKRERREKRQQAGETIKQEPRTVENTSKFIEALPPAETGEKVNEAWEEELGAYYKEGITPKIIITTSPRARVKAWKLCFELKKCIPNSEVFARKNVPIKSIVRQASAREYTDLIVVHEDNREPNGVLICHLPDGPTAYFKLNSLKYSKEIKGVGESTAHLPEVLLTNFNTRLGRVIAHMCGNLFPPQPQFAGRRVVTIHNQRDYIFFRHHRYEFKKEGEKAALHELGPRFTLRLRWLQLGPYNPRSGDYAWVYKTRMDAERKRFFL